VRTSVVWGNWQLPHAEGVLHDSMLKCVGADVVCRECRVKLKDFKFHRNNTRLPELRDSAEARKVVTMQKAHQITVASVAQWLDQEIHKMRASRTEHDLPQVLFRSRSPRHFLGGEWNTGGHCDHMQVLLLPPHHLNTHRQ